MRTTRLQVTLREVAPPVVRVAARLMTFFDWGWSRDGQPLTEEDLGLEIARLTRVLTALDQVETDLRVWRAGPSALTLLPRATVLARAWALTA